jgi:type IV pilus assembly protein PilQ
MMRRLFLPLAAAIACAGAASAAQLAAVQTPAPDLRELLKPVPASGAGGAGDAGARRADSVVAIPKARLEAESTGIAQVLGSTASGTTTKAYTITHLRAAEVQALVADPAAPLLGRDSTVVADSRSNTLFVKGSEADHQLVENLVRRIDVPVKQILVEVKIVSADDFFGKSLGARFGITASHLLNVASGKGTGVQVAGSGAELNNIATTGTSTFSPMVSLPATNTLTSASPSTFAVGLYKIPAGININLELSALEEAGHTKVLSSPKLVLSNFKPGLLSSGQRIPYSRPSIVQGVNTTEFVDAKVSITVTALVAPDGSISMDLTLTDDSVGAVSAVGPTINTNQVTSNVTLRSGETLLLGGFQNSVQTKETDKTPLLGDVPVLGNLFKSTTDTSVKRELLFVITPTVIDAGM